MARVFYSDERTTVQTDRGPVRGYFCDDTYLFKGIPYAKAERFLPPAPPAAWEKPLDATTYGYVCPLMQQERPSGELLVPHRYWLYGEDCLNLNVWTPGLDGERRPVLVWLHGGGYVSGSAIEHDAYDGTNMSRYGDAVIVSVNHRLNVLGYLDLSPLGEKYENSGNCGGDDIIAALRWVRDNIAAFGGDPDNVTLFGQSGGGGKITTLLQSPAADGLYHKGFIMSGVIPENMLGAETGDSMPLVEALTKELGLTPREAEEGWILEHGDELAEALRELPYQRLADAYQKISPALAQVGAYSGGIPKANASYLGSPVRVGFREETKHIPLMVGSVFGEFDFMELTFDKRSLTRKEGEAIARARLGGETFDQALPYFEKAYPDRNPVDLGSLDAIFRPASIKYIQARAKQQGAAPVYSYLFDMDFPIQNGKSAWHCSDIPYVFHNTQMVPAVNVVGVTDELEKQIFACVMSFARTGNPSHPGIPAWERAGEKEEPVMFFGKRVHQEVNSDHELMRILAPKVTFSFAADNGEMDIKH